MFFLAKLLVYLSFSSRNCSVLDSNANWRHSSAEERIKITISSTMHFSVEYYVRFRALMH